MKKTHTIIVDGCEHPSSAKEHKAVRSGEHNTSAHKKAKVMAEIDGLLNNELRLELMNLLSSKEGKAALWQGRDMGSSWFELNTIPFSLQITLYPTPTRQLTQAEFVKFRTKCKGFKSYGEIAVESIKKPHA